MLLFFVGVCPHSQGYYSLPVRLDATKVLCTIPACKEGSCELHRVTQLPEAITVAISMLFLWVWILPYSTRQLNCTHCCGASLSLCASSIGFPAPHPGKPQIQKAKFFPVSMQSCPLSPLQSKGNPPTLPRIAEPCNVAPGQHFQPQSHFSCWEPSPHSGHLQH